MNRELLEEVLYALEYASDMTKPEGLSGCDCPICTVIPKVEAELAKPDPEPYGYVSEHNCTGPFKHQFHFTQETIYPDNCKAIVPVYLGANNES